MYAHCNAQCKLYSYSGEYIGGYRSQNVLIPINIISLCELRSLFWSCFSYSPSTWALDCGGGDVSSCVDPTETQLFPITSSVTFTDIPINTGPPKTRCLTSAKWITSTSGPTDSNLECVVAFLLFPPSGFRSTSQSMTVTGMMSVGLSSPSPWPSITQVGFYLDLENLSGILSFPFTDHSVIWRNNWVTEKSHQSSIRIIISIIPPSELKALWVGLKETSSVLHIKLSLQYYCIWEKSSIFCMSLCGCVALWVM